MMQSDQPDSCCKKALFHLDNAIVTPTIASREKRTFTGCVYDETGHIVTASQRPSSKVLWKPVDPVSIATDEPADEVEGQCVYLGHFTCHYGHFLLETLSRFWALSKIISIDKYVFQPFVLKMQSPLLFSPAKICFECFGIRSDRVLLINRRMMFRHLTVPTVLFEVFNDANEEQALIYSQIGDYCESRYGKLMKSKYHDSLQPLRLYLSRKKMKGFRPVVNENEVELLFASLGFTIIYPEQMSFGEQVVLYRRAAILAGFQGSAMHNSVFMKKDTLVINIGDLRQPDINRNQQICDGFSNVRSAFVRFSGGVVDQVRNIGKLDIPYLRFELEQLL